MKLIGMLDSPYVRRVAISAKCLGIALEHQSVSVFRHFEQFRQINPVVLDQVEAARFPLISAFTDYAEGLEVFVDTPIE